MSSASLVLTDEFTGALALLNSGTSLFLTGKAGTGKSTLIRHYLATTERNVVVVAPTGIAALNVDGYTIHRLFSFHPSLNIEEVKSGRYYPARFASAIKGMDTLIIDEASMVRADLLDMVAAALERFGPKPGAPFGGVQIVLVGDLLQLPPVVTEHEASYFAERYPTPFFYSADCYDREQFPTASLTKVFRQIGDQRLTAILNAIREGVLVDEAERELNSRVNQDFDPPPDEFWLTLAPTARIVQARNKRQLDLLPTAEIHSRATTSGDLDGFDLPHRDDQLTFKVGAQIMMLTNHPFDRWVNGTIGRVLDVTMDESTGIGVLVRFDDGTEAMVRPHTWEITRPVVHSGRLTSEVVGTYTQLPFQLAWAITIHKSQGQTLDRLVVDLTGGAFASGQVYVALSRCTSMDGLVLKRPVMPKDLKTDRRVMRFLKHDTSAGTEQRFCAISVLTVGEVGRLHRPRPVEIAVAFDDGTAVSTLINPGSDLYDARSQYGISVPDVLLAPTLDQAWTVLGPILEGWTPVGFDLDRTLEFIDFELKRHGMVTRLPIGISLPSDADTTGSDAVPGPTALMRARAALAVQMLSTAVVDDAEPFAEAGATSVSVSHLLTRDSEVASPSLVDLPTISGLMAVSRQLSGTLFDNDRHTSHLGSGFDDIKMLIGAGLMAVAARHVPLPPELAVRLPAIDELLETSLTELNEAASNAAPSIGQVLTPGALVCFSGTALAADGQHLSKDDLAALGAVHGLVRVESVTKKKCDALVTAEAGSQSRKAKTAADYGKPVFSADEFLAWVAGQGTLP